MSTPRNPDRLIVFTRYPDPGRAKTRLAPLLGADEAAELHRRMAVHCITIARRAGAHMGYALEIHYAGRDEQSFVSWLGPDLDYREQTGGDLGVRMANAFDHAFTQNAERVVIIGTDCPQLSASIIDDAFTKLRNYDLVLGPASDGGYYLIGLRAPQPKLFQGITWSTDTVYSKTMKIAEAIPLRSAALSELSDIDRPEDLPLWDEVIAAKFLTTDTERITVIIPALNEVSNIATTVACAMETPDAEIIVADGGSTDSTVSLAREYGATVISTEPGRALQMNAGAQAASGKIFLFLHADTRLPKSYADMIRAAFTNQVVVAGAFHLTIPAKGMIYRLIEFMANHRTRRRQLPYGDQAVFLRKQTFDRLRGFPIQPIMEDYEFIQRLRKMGRIQLLDAAVTTSARRWEAVGPWKLTILHQAIIAAYRCGVSTERIARWRR